MNMRILLILSAIGLCLAPGCKKEASPKAQETVSEAEIKNAQLIENLQKSNASNRDAFDKVNSSLTPPRRPVIAYEVQETNARISKEDAGRSYLFTGAHVQRCFGAALIRDENAAGTCNIAISRASGGTAELTVEKCDIASPEVQAAFHQCLAETGAQWRLPEGASFKAQLKFSSLPALTPDELAPHTMQDGHDH